MYDSVHAILQNPLLWPLQSESWLSVYDILLYAICCPPVLLILIVSWMLLWTLLLVCLASEIGVSVLSAVWWVFLMVPIRPSYLRAISDGDVPLTKLWWWGEETSAMAGPSLVIFCHLKILYQSIFAQCAKYARHFGSRYKIPHESGLKPSLRRQWNLPMIS